MNTAFLVLHIIVTVALIAVVLLQEGKDPGMKGIAGSSPDGGDSFFSRNSGRTKASMLSKLTTVLAILFLITTVVLCILNA
ncbi:MAG: preprotein translocase subunit SecG [Clostridia bacterium]|nr:preprotein translocase subunit SecG [Clostridia bacterium]